MMKSSTFLVLSILLIVSMFFPTLVNAQSEPKIAQMEIAFWPEYDRHAILVIYRVQLAADTFLPAQIRLPIPSEAGDPYAVAWLDENDQLLVADFTSEPHGDWQIITLTSGGISAQLEYYIDYADSETLRSFSFSWPEGFAIEDLSYEVQEPITAENFEVIPSPDRSITGNEGLVYHLADLGPVSADSSIDLGFSYSNPSGQLSADIIAAPVPVPQPSPVVGAGGTPDIYQIMPWLLGGLGVILVVVGGYFYYQSRRKPVVVKRKRQRSSRRKPSANDEGQVDSSLVYCHQCGTRASVSDHFCRHCGVALRR